MRFNENHMRRFVFMLFLSLPLLFSCRSVEEKGLDETMRSLSVAGELVTCEYTVSKVIKADDMVPWKIGERKSCKSMPRTSWRNTIPPPAWRKTRQNWLIFITIWVISSIWLKTTPRAQRLLNRHCVTILRMTKRATIWPRLSTC